jgi:CheY-like chemotaxis protein
MAKVLLVDNDATTVSLLKILLELDGYGVIVCSAPDKVLAAVSTEAPDVVLMDVFLTGGDGLDLLRKMRATPGMERIPVVMTSGMELSRECEQAGADGFLLKPYPPEQLSQVIKTNLDHGRNRDVPGATP